MKYCYRCGRMTAGDPLFCNFCGRSYDVKLCPRLHRNPRAADVCSQCGSRELSTPQPKVSFFSQLLAYFLRIVLGSFLVFLSLTVCVAILREVVTSSQVQNGLVVLALLLGGLWWAWSMLPTWFRKLIHRVMKRKEHGDAHSQH
jgi:hypothetical protein